ncbi:hypothetical protein [Albirhodobacter sp. R86504]|uniref:hypothetical protein n=1 Tax=Albirhodobacter sp. R86504 TaxID=3093848 RepID=UPI0036706E2E
MKRKLLMAVSLIAVLAGCKSDEETARESLGAAIELVTGSRSARSQTAAYQDLIKAQEMLQAISRDQAGTETALRIAAGERIGEVSLAELGALIETAQIGMEVEQCESTPTAACLFATLQQDEIARGGEAARARFSEVPQAFRDFLTLIDGGEQATAALNGHPRDLSDPDLFELLMRLMNQGHEATAKAWLAATAPKAGAEIVDWPSFLHLAAENHSGRNLIQTPVTWAMAARLAKADGAAAEYLVTQIGGLEAIKIAMGKDPLKTLARWREAGWARKGSDAEGLAAVVLWEAGEKEAARAIFAHPDMSSNDFVIDSLPKLTSVDGRKDLLIAALGQAKAPGDISRIAMAVIGLGDAEAAKPAITVLSEDSRLREGLARFAQSAGVDLGRANSTALKDALLAMPEAQFDAAARDALNDGWHVGRLLEGENEAFQTYLGGLSSERGLRLMHAAMWEMLLAKQADAATTLFNAVVDQDIDRSTVDKNGQLVEIALLAGKFDLAARGLNGFRGFNMNFPRAMRLRLSMAGAPQDEEDLFRVLDMLDENSLAGAVADLAATDRHTGAGFPQIAARYALALERDLRIRALQGLLQTWPGKSAS